MSTLSLTVAEAKSVWHHNRLASWYYIPGGHTACGRTMTKESIWVAALKPELAHCGMRVTICHQKKCVRVKVLDRGAWREDRRDWDMTLATKNKLRCSDLCSVRWRKTNG